MKPFNKTLRTYSIDGDLQKFLNTVCHDYLAYKMEINEAGPIRRHFLTTKRIIARQRLADKRRQNYIPCISSKHLRRGGNSLVNSITTNISERLKNIDIKQAKFLIDTTINFNYAIIHQSRMYKKFIYADNRYFHHKAETWELALAGFVRVNFIRDMSSMDLDGCISSLNLLFDFNDISAEDAKKDYFISTCDDVIANKLNIIMAELLDDHNNNDNAVKRECLESIMSVETSNPFLFSKLDKNKLLMLKIVG